MPRVNVPDVGVVNFPDDMPLEAVTAAANRFHREAILKSQGEIRAAPSPLVGFGQRVLQRSGLPASPQAVGQLADQPLLQRLMLPLGVINLPFAAVGETAQAGAEALGARPPTPGGPTSALDFLLSPGSLAELGTAFAVPAAIQAVRTAPLIAEEAIRSMIPSVGRVGRVTMPSAPIAQQARRAFEEPPSMIQSAPLAPPVAPGAPGQGLPLLQPGVLPSQAEVAAARAGMRGPGLLSATEQPLITAAPARIARGTSEIVDPLGRRVPTRPPVHVEPADSVLPPTLAGRVPTALEAAVARRRLAPTRPSELGPVPPPPTAPMSEEAIDLFNRITRESGFVAPVVAARLGGAAIGGAGGAVSGAQFGETPEEKLKFGIAGGLAGAVTGAAAPSLVMRFNARRAKQIEFAERADIAVRSQRPELRRAEALVVGQRLTTPLSLPDLDRTVAAVNDALVARGHSIGGAEPFTLRLAKLIDSDPTLAPAIGAAVRQRGGAMMDVAQMLVDDSRSRPASLLARAGGLSRILEQEVSSNPAVAQLLNEVMRQRPRLTFWDQAGHFARTADNIWRGALVAAWRTAINNAGIQQARVGLEAVEQFIDGAMVQATGMIARARGAGPAPVDDMTMSAAGRFAWEYALGAGSNVVSMLGRPVGLPPLQRTREINSVLEAFPPFRDKLLQLYSSDVARHLQSFGPGLARAKGGELRPLGPVATQIDRVFRGAETGIYMANALNRFQEVLTRKAASRAQLLQFLERRGIQDLDAIPVGQLPVEDVARMTTRGLRLTFAESPSREAPGAMERFFAGVLDATGTKARFAVALHAGAGLPFVRFMWNAGRFVAERPFASTTTALRTLWRLSSPAERAAVTRGEVGTIGKTVTGWTALLAARQFVESEFVGDGILEMKTPLGSFRLNTLGPLVPAYVWVAQLEKHWRDGTLVARAPEFIREAQNLTRRAEDLLVGVDSLIANAPEIVTALAEGSGEAAEQTTRGLRRAAGETLAGSLQFMTTVQRLFAAYGQFIPELEEMARQENIKRDVRGAPFVGPLQARVPGFLQPLGIPSMADLPLQTSALRAGNIPIETPPQVRGIPLPADIIGLRSVPPRTSSEVEALQLGMKPREIAGQPTSFPGADRLVREATGIGAEPVLENLLASPGFAELPRELRAVIFGRVMEQMRDTARQAVRVRIAEKLRGSEGLSDEEREFFDASLKAATDPRMRELLRKEGVQVPR